MDSVGNFIFYFVIAIAIIVFSVLAVTSKKILRAATYLLFVLLATAFIYFQMDYQFLGAVQIAIYAGGIAVLFVFAIMLTHKPGHDAPPLVSAKKWVGLSACLGGVAVCAYALFSYGQFCVKTLAPAGNYDIETLGNALLDSNHYGYLLPFEAISVLLLACIIGGVVIARRR